MGWTCASCETMCLLFFLTCPRLNRYNLAVALGTFLEWKTEKLGARFGHASSVRLRSESHAPYVQTYDRTCTL